MRSSALSSKRSVGTAEAVGALFFPINPGGEEESWKELHDRGYETFLDGSFGGTYQLLEKRRGGVSRPSQIMCSIGATW